MAPNEVDPTGNALVLAQLDGLRILVDTKLEGVISQIGQTDRNASQMVRLVEEKLSNQARTFDDFRNQIRDRDRSLDTRLKERDNEINNRFKDVATALEHQNEEIGALKAVDAGIAAVDKYRKWMMALAVTNIVALLGIAASVITK